LGASDLVVLDASWYLPAAERNPEREYDAAHIPGALFFDHDAIAEPNSTLPHTLPSPEDFACHASQMGISTESRIVIYDGAGYFSAPRAWWMFRTTGAKQAYVLDGGFKGWQDEGKPTTSEPTPTPTPTIFTPAFDPHAVVTLNEMRTIVTQGAVQIADARGWPRFSGMEEEPRVGVRSGHMPGARNIPYAALSENGYFKSPDDIRAIFTTAGIALDEPIIASCGSGVTAAVLVLALQGLGHNNIRLYDGSWAEWGTLPDTPVVQNKN